MVQIDELRRGNIIRLNSTNNFVKIDGYYADFIGYLDIYDRKWISYKEFDPVDFTQNDILVKCGFQATSNPNIWLHKKKLL
jgi:hypothetical protein